MKHTPIIPRHPLDHPGSIKIMLSRATSEAIAANADYHLAAISHPDSTSPPEALGRLILVCLPMTKETANAAYRVATGTHKAVRIKAKPDTRGADAK